MSPCINHQRLNATTAMIAALLLTWSHAQIGAAEPRGGKLTGEQLKQQAVILAEFRKARSSPDERLEIIDRAAEHSLFSLKNVQEILVKEMNKPLSEYRLLFTKAATETIGKRASPVNLQQVAELRARVLALSKQEALTKEMIVANGDPALKRLKEIILVNREEVLAGHPELVKKRESLELLGKQWEKCATRMIEELDEAIETKETTEATAKKGRPDANGGANEAAVGAADETVISAPPSFEDYLKKEEEIAAALAVPMDAATRAVLATNLQLATRIDPEEARCVLDLNLTRNLLGLPPVQIDLTLAIVARDHSADMEHLRFFSHDSPIPGKATPWDRAKRAGTTASAENIAAGTLDGAVANMMWWHSPGHHKNMLGSHSRVGLGRTGKYWTELFGR